jgi:hypothetical protein
MQKQVVKRRKLTPHLDFYNKCVQEEGLPNKEKGFYAKYWGLCECAEKRYIDKELLERFKPRKKDLRKLEEEGSNPIFWASGSSSAELGEFTSLRQTIVLFMAAVNGEL